MNTRAGSILPTLTSGMGMSENAPNASAIHPKAGNFCKLSFLRGVRGVLPGRKLHESKWFSILESLDAAMDLSPKAPRDRLSNSQISLRYAVAASDARNSKHAAHGLTFLSQHILKIIS
jgi:hypothetical protein